MEYQIQKAKCLICGSEFTQRGISKHIQSCLNKRFKKVIDKDVTYYLLYIHPDFTKDYFLYLLVTQNTTLEDLDWFLRAIWLECCYHMSAFFYGKYSELPKEHTISDVEKISKEIFYHYDFGSTTALHIKIIGKYEGPEGLEGNIAILSRNRQPIIPCDECGEREAVQICTACVWDGGGWLCEECVKKHPCEEEMLLPVCNSPRTGVCAYTGEEKEIRTDKALNNFLKLLEKKQD